MSKIKDKIKNFKIDKNLSSKEKFEKSKQNLKELSKLIGFIILIIISFNLIFFTLYGVTEFLIDIVNKIFPCNFYSNCSVEGMLLGIPITIILSFILIFSFIILEISVLLSIVVTIILVIILIVYAFIVLHYSEQVRIEKKKNNN